MASLLPDDGVVGRLKMRMVEIVKRILVDHLHVFEGVPLQMHIPHEYSAVTAKKSHVVSATQTFNYCKAASEVALTLHAFLAEFMHSHSL